MPRMPEIDRLRTIQSSLRELKSMAQADGDELLNYLLDMSYVHVSDALRSAHASMMSSQITDRHAHGYKRTAMGLVANRSH